MPRSWTGVRSGHLARIIRNAETPAAKKSPPPTGQLCSGSLPESSV